MKQRGKKGESCRNFATKPNGILVIANSAPTFLNSQCWVTLALSWRVRLGAALTVPIRSWLLEESGSAVAANLKPVQT
jgi:hypothetical protein